ncbi:hypothetical protein MRX96_000390 [Rhipicephalus microplus]
MASGERNHTPVEAPGARPIPERRECNENTLEETNVAETCTERSGSESLETRPCPAGRPNTTIAVASTSRNQSFRCLSRCAPFSWHCMRMRRERPLCFTDLR